MASIMTTPDVRPVGDLPDAIGKTAARELSGYGITSLRAVARFTKQELLAIHGVGPKAVRSLGEALRAKKLAFGVNRTTPDAKVNEAGKDSE